MSKRPNTGDQLTLVAGAHVCYFPGILVTVAAAYRPPQLCLSRPGGLLADSVSGLALPPGDRR